MKINRRVKILAGKKKRGRPLTGRKNQEGKLKGQKKLDEEERL